MAEYIISAFEKPMYLVVLFLVAGILTYFFYAEAVDSDNRVGSSVAMFLFLPSLILFIGISSAGAVVGTHYLKKAYLEADMVMEAQIKKDYSVEILALKEIDDMLEDIKKQASR